MVYGTVEIAPIDLFTTTNRMTIIDLIDRLDFFSHQSTDLDNNIPHLRAMQKVFAGVLFTFGFVFLLMSASVMLSNNPSKDDRDAALGGLMLGLPAMAGGTAIVLNMRRKKQELAATQSQQLETTFVELLHNTNGRISVVEFAVASKLSIADSKQYLDRKVSQLNGDFDVSEDGKISYRFDFR